MEPLQGGLRDRLIDTSIFNYVRDGLTALGWFDAATTRAPITLRDHAVDDDEQITPNIIAMSSEAVTPTDMEIGSNATIEEFDVWFDIYAENDALGKHIAGDLRGMLAGQMPQIDYVTTFIPVMDWTIATPAQIATVEVTSTDRYRNRRHIVEHSHERHWWTVLATIEDARP